MIAFVHLPSENMTITFVLNQETNSLELYTRHISADLAKGLGDVLNLIVQEYWQHFPLPFERLKAIGDKSVWPKELWISEKSI